jgi:outer membrane protein
MLMYLTRAIAPALLVCGLALGAGYAQDRPEKIAVIEFQNAVTATNEFQRDFAEVQKKFEPKRVELKNLTDEIDRLTKELQTEGAKLTEAQQAERARTLDAKQKQAQRLSEDDQNDYQHAVQDVLSRVAQKVGDALTTYAKEHGLTLVIDASGTDQQGPMVLWASPTLDITKKIVEAYNAKSGVPAQSAGLPAAPAPSARK